MGVVVLVVLLDIVVVSWLIHDATVVGWILGVSAGVVVVWVCRRLRALTRLQAARAADLTARHGERRPVWAVPARLATIDLATVDAGEPTDRVGAPLTASDLDALSTVGRGRVYLVWTVGESWVWRRRAGVFLARVASFPVVHQRIQQTNKDPDGLSRTKARDEVTIWLRLGPDLTLEFRLPPGWPSPNEW